MRAILYFGRWEFSNLGHLFQRREKNLAFDSKNAGDINSRLDLYIPWNQMLCMPGFEIYEFGVNNLCISSSSLTRLILFFCTVYRLHFLIPNWPLILCADSVTIDLDIYHQF